MGLLEVTRHKPNLPLLPNQKEEKQCKVSGRLVHKLPENLGEPPLQFPDVTTKLRVLDSHGNKIYSLYPNNEGKFGFQIPAKCVGILKKTNTVILEILHESRPFANNGLFGYKEGSLVLQKIKKTIPRGLNEVDLGDIQLDYAEQYFDPSKIKRPSYNELPNAKYIYRFITGLFPYLAERSIEKAVEALVGFLGDHLSAHTAQMFFDFKQGNKYPPKELSFEVLAETLMNSVAAVKPKIQGDQAIWECNWDKFEKDKPDAFGQVKDLANVKVVATLDPLRLAKPVIESITYQFTQEEEPSVVDRSSNDKEAKQRAVYIANSSFIVLGEAQNHLAQGHLLTGTIAKSFRKCIPIEHPIYQWLDPHFEGIDFINYLGSKGVIFGEKSILELGALSVKGLNDLIITSMQEAADWNNYEPREALSNEEFDCFAHSEQACYKGLTELFKQLIEDKWEEISKPESWSQLWRWSAMVHYHFDAFEPFIRGKIAPEDGDKERLVRIFVFSLALVFKHYLNHSSQDIAANILSCSLGITNKALTKDGHFAIDGNTPTDIAARQIIVSRFLLEFDARRMLDEDNFVDPNIRALFKNLVENSALRYYQKAKHLHKDVEI